LAEAERKSGDLSNDLTKAEKLAKLQILTSPIDGTVEQLVVHTIGRVVTPAQALLAIVPSDWPAPGSEDTKFGVTMGPEVGHGEAEVYAGVQA
jgi:multidrug efflux pump subunit AcrA (membrane-fusion protein)